MKLRYRKYQELWEQKKGDQKRTNICELVNWSRNKFEQRERATLKEKKENIPADKWKETLRYSADLSHFYDRSFVEDIRRDGITLKGVSKMAKEADWIASKTSSVFKFYEKDKKEVTKGTQEKDKNASEVKTVKFSKVNQF